MAKSRTFSLLNSVTVDQIGEHLVNWFQFTKGMESEGGRAQGGGYFVQARDKQDGWKSVSGMTKALQIQIIKADDCAVVNCDFGKWSDKVGAGALGMFVFAPLAVTAGIGAYKQSKLPDEVFTEIEKFIMSGGQTAVKSIQGRLADDEVSCPSCSAKNPKDQKFCSSCGARLGATCPNCGAAVEAGAKFCPECGGSVEKQPNLCVNCGQPLSEGAKFCASCGASQEKKCLQCGAAMGPGELFCPSCGASASGKRFCPSCKSELSNPDALFCPQCGTRIE